jgi:hypothetical protein
MAIRRTLSVLASLAVVLAVIACSSDTPANDTSVASGSVYPTPQAVQGDSIDLAKYRLTMAKVEQTLVAGRNLAIKMKGMSQAEREKIDIGGGDDTIEQMAAKIEAQPLVNSSIKEAGLTAKEYVTITMAMLQAGMGAAVADMSPKANQDSLAREMNTNPDNIKFIRANKAELERKQKALEDELKKLGIG